MNDSNITHAMSHSKIYKAYHGIKDRCYNNKNAAYNHYGARGIIICKEWLDNFENFYSWAMKNGYKEGLSIDRIDVNGNYEPSNCRWATMKIQNNNRRNNHLLTYNNETLTISQWSEKLHINKNTIIKRLRLGWSIEKTLSTKMRGE